MTEKSESSPSFQQIRTNSEQRQSFPAARPRCYAVLCMLAKKEMIPFPNLTLPDKSLKCLRVFALRWRTRARCSGHA
ncbi:hypothetical protein F7725_027277 [Dissostichus mawsoni]|uniref:Uncharacterized protein n=1 Tax=Dissostichus mawsoni TaxID=36200 RepID=A0A7J5XDE0_DISMA|nr:hypothetical protein F7725_027277 [Dissostichus mawsoni]